MKFWWAPPASPGFLATMAAPLAIPNGDTGSTTTLQLAASNVGAFLGVQRCQADEFGVRVSGASAALVIEKPAGVAPKFAVRTSLGTVSVPGLPDLDLSGPTALEINRLGGNLALDIDGFATLDGTFSFEKQNDVGAVNETISTPDGPVTLDFSSSADIQVESECPEDSVHEAKRPVQAERRSLSEPAVATATAAAVWIRGATHGSHVKKLFPRDDSRHSISARRKKLPPTP